MSEIGIVLIVVGVLGIVLYLVLQGRSRTAQTEGGAPGAQGGVLDPLAAEVGGRAKVAEFHIKGDEAQVTFDVPFPDEGDEVLADLLVDEAVEVVREKRHSLPIDDVAHVVAFAGSDQPREIGRTKLPSPGELPPPTPGFDFSKMARDPFAEPFEQRTDHSVSYETKVDVPADELGPIRDEIRLPAGLERGLRATGVDPDELDATEFILGLLRMFGYTVNPLGEENSYLAAKGGVTTFIRTDPYQPGDHPELSESTIRRFLADFGASGADRGMLLSGKYAPYRVYEIEGRQPKVRFVTRERIQGFVDSMALS